jgi:hypothetical protein
MKKNVLIVVVSLLILQLSAQTDSLKIVSFSGVQLDYGIVGGLDESLVSQQEYQKFVKTNSLLNKDLSLYTSNNYGYFYQQTFIGFISLRAFTDITTNKKIKKEVFVGLRYGQRGMSNLNYNTQRYDTIGVYIDPVSNDVVTKVLNSRSEYNFGINSNKLIIPLGINITTNKQRYLWLTAGIEIAPALSFGYVFIGSNTETSSIMYLFPGQVLNNKNSILNNVDYQSTRKTEFNKLKGIGLSGYLSVPLSVNLRLSKNINILKHLSASATIVPAFSYSKHKYTGTESYLTVNTNVGLRYNIR